MVATASSPRRSGRARSSVSRFAPDSAPKAVPRKPAARKAAAPAAKASKPAKADTTTKKTTKATKPVNGVLTFVLSDSREGFDVTWSEGKGGSLYVREASLTEVIGKFCANDRVKVVGRIRFEDIDGEAYDEDATLDDAMGDEEGWVSAKFK